MCNINTTTSKLGSAVSNLYFYLIFYLKLRLLETGNVYNELSYYGNKTKRARLWFRVHKCLGKVKKIKHQICLTRKKAIVSTHSKEEGGERYWWECTVLHKSFLDIAPQVGLSSCSLWLQCVNGSDVVLKITVKSGLRSSNSSQDIKKQIIIYEE